MKLQCKQCTTILIATLVSNFVVNEPAVELTFNLEINMSVLYSEEKKLQLTKVHELRMQAHWGKNANLGPWPEEDREWRQTPYGAPWDTNVYMAEWTLALAQKIYDAGLLKTKE